MLDVNTLSQLPTIYTVIVVVLAVLRTITAGVPSSLTSLTLTLFTQLLQCGATLAALLVVAGASFMATMWTTSRLSDKDHSPVDWDQWLSFKDPSLRGKYGTSRVPMQAFYEDFISGRVDLKVDVRSLFEQHKNKLFRMCFTPFHIRFLLGRFLPQGMSHAQEMDIEEVAGTYDRGNDFYRAFLGPMMVYTSGIFSSYKDSLEDAQRNKLDIVCRKVQLQQGERLLDIGCGWGTLAIHAAKYYGCHSTAVTIAKEQIVWAKGKQKEAGVPSNKVDFLYCDYRDIPKNKRWDKITCLEMAEHVGVKNFPKFMNQVYNMLEDDGIFYLQIAGLRRAWQYEDLIWGMFMGTYIFPAADASLPLAWVVAQLESAGFEVQSHENAGIHYSETISRWLDNCIKNKDSMISSFGDRWYRIWIIFLAWSMMIARGGGSTLHMIVAYKNKDAYDRTKFVGTRSVPPVTSAAGVSANKTLFPSDKWVGA
ncbi:Cyclopropane-fatty-acyl-phospholipid synthase, putative [Perkinsus marinus ATCC 50983]|uniref:sphingolipid C(9)-methyltransferase n=1 Tax=Perkinsus marinus (strain ATCC 50983 / TXsc) TaxID=423536 RepID=C5KF30_PERM5|nr:Cyclopropane-fatty-acyl-phospholipid synthase, putative [Perkinsus marinus ATCC 50983]EER16912.1 Cyclopropane-fatty-acyl-phospholipid synthase, putative [Perkinsus marinus ATCC 50983]|eukprot:XP_002785116.1 Cyclopropane-fatty-acyl-phospholipid synthase, putative [Perkinsus marinus ATCC 50983]